jgi:hypothetical protein
MKQLVRNGARKRTKPVFLRIWRERANVPEDPQLEFLFLLE